MEAPIKQKLGNLSVTVASDSDQLRYNAPIEIRDSRMRLIEQSENDRKFALQPGLYQISAVLEDGQEHSRFVEVKSDEDANVELSAPMDLDVEVTFEQSPPTVRSPGPATRGVSKKSYEAPRYTQKLESISEEAEEPFPGEPSAELLDVQGASLLRQTRKLWIFERSDNDTHLAFARMRLGGRTVEISLPVSQPGDFGPVTCAVRVDSSPSGSRATAWISPERTVANAFMNMLASGKLREAVHMADGAVELFRQKYRDPTGATLGALILHKVGQLDEYRTWVDNIVRDFPWIPDAQILLASILVKQRSELDLAWKLASEASEHRPLYTESYSILLDMLRRWPRDHRTDSHQDTLAKLAQHSPYLDWDSICFSRTIED